MQQQISPHKGEVLTGLEAHLAVQPIGQGQGRQPQGVQPHRQQQLPLTRRGIEQHRHRLKTAIDQAPVEAAGRPLQHRPGLSLGHLQLAQAPVGGAIGQAHRGQGGVETSQIHRRGRCWRWHHHQGRVCGGCTTNRNFAMAQPGGHRRAVGAAVEADAAGSPVALQALVSRLADQLQRLVELQGPERQRLTRLLQQVQCRRDEARRRKHGLAADAVVAQVAAQRAQQGLIHGHIPGEVEPHQGLGLRGSG